MAPKITRWLPFAVLTTCLYAVLFVACQQVVRRSANTLPEQLATDLAGRLANSTSIIPILPPQIDLDESPAPFVITYDASGTMLSSTATLDHQPPKLPSGVLTAARIGKPNRITWQPKNSVREAIVVVSYNLNGTIGYVLAGQSLHSAEQLEDTILHLAAAGWIVTLILTWITLSFAVDRSKK